MAGFVTYTVGAGYYPGHQISPANETVHRNRSKDHDRRSHATG
jgi:hypothetical protein